MSTIYRQIIVDNYKNPMNKGRMRNPDVSVEDSNPLCGDKIRIELKIKDKKVSDVKFSGKGCAISQAAASLLTEEIKGKSLKKIIGMKNEMITSLLGIELSANRIMCALLPLKVVKIAVIKSYKQ